MQALNRVELPRFVKPDNVTGNAELHGFCDGGEQAYGAAIWLRWPTSDGFVLRFVAAKSFVAPIKRKSTPRLELLGALILSRMLTFIKTIIVASNVYMWTDSAVVLHWLSKPSSKFKAFVSTRVQEIQESLSDIPACFKYIDSKLNPADALTKPIHVSKLAKWHLGPQFLVLPPKEWPLGKPPLDKLSSTAQGEEKCPPPFVLHSEQLIDFTSHLLARISSWQKLVRVVAWLKRPLINRENRISILTSRELTNAKLCLFWIAQDYLREPEQQRLCKRMNLTALNTQPALLRICGRLSNFSYNDEVTKPIALPSNNEIVVLYADYMHRKLGHQGYRVIILDLRLEGIYILRGKQLLKQIAARCITCRINRRNLMKQQMGQLPTFRFKVNQPPFTSVSMDFFGPIKLRKTRNVVIDGCVLLITCNTTRVDHLEVTETQSTNDFILALRRFVSKRGTHPVHVFSDQGKAFIGAENPIRQWISGWNKTIIADFMAAHHTSFTFEWKYNISQASHMNGVAESLIKSCRKVFDAASNYRTRAYTRNEWETIVAEANYLLNSRPLFPKSVDDLDEEPFTGNILLYPHGQPSIPQPQMIEPLDPRISYKSVQSFVKQFWEAWIRHMPPHLLFRNKWFRPRKNLKTGDYVITL